MRRLVSYVVAALAMVVVSAGLVAAPAQAGPQHYGTDPYYSGCSADSFPYRTYPILNGSAVSVAQVQLWYSRICQTNWVRVTGNPAGGNTVKRISAANGQAWDEVDYGTGFSYGMQVYAPPGVCVEFLATLFYPNGAWYASSNWQVAC